jgi:hypothetical protein
MPKSSQKKGGAKKEYTGTYRHFTLHEVNGKSVDIGTADIKDHQTPLNAAKKLLSSYCRHEGIKSNERNKVNIIFTIRETTRGHSKVYGPYKGKFVKYDKPLMIKLKSGKVIKRTVKPMVSLKKNKNNKMVGGQSNTKYTSIDSDSLYKYVQSIKNKKYFEYPQFPKDFSKLDVSSVTEMGLLFKDFKFAEAKRAGFTFNIENWVVDNVYNMNAMFANSDFDGKLSWLIKPTCNTKFIFSKCPNVLKLTNLDECPTSIKTAIKFKPLTQFSNGRKEKIWSLKDDINITITRCAGTDSTDTQEKFMEECSPTAAIFNVYYRGSSATGDLYPIEMRCKENKTWDMLRTC